MTRKLISVPFINIRSAGEGPTPPLSDTGNMVLSIDNENKKLITSKDGGAFQPLDQEFRDGITIDEDGVLQGIGTEGVRVDNSNITVDPSGRIQGIGTPGIKVNNDKVFEDPRFVNIEQKVLDLEPAADNTIELKASKIFFKYNGDNQPVPGQQIEILFVKGSALTGTPIIEVVPGDKGVQLAETEPGKYSLDISEFNKAEADSIEIKATFASASGVLTDSVTIYKARDGMNSLVGGLTNPFVAVQVNGSGVVDGSLQSILNSAGGIFTVLKGTDNLTGDISRISYSIESIPEAFLDGEGEPTVAISASGAYSFTGFDVNELIGELIFVATDLLTGQQLRSKFTMVVVRQGEDGLPGASGTSARTVKLTADDSQIAYRSDDQLLDPAAIMVQATQQNHEGTVFYEFVVSEGLSGTEIVLCNTTSDAITLTDELTNYGSGLSYTFIESTKTAFGKSKTLKVRTREGSATAAVKAEDAITIIATKDGSDALEVVFENSNHSFVASASGLVSDYTGGGSVVEAYIGNEQLNAKASGTPGNGEFVVSINTQSDISSGPPAVDSSNPKRIIIGDPSGMANNKDTASVTYTITGKSSTGVQKTQSIKASFSKSKQGVTGSNGVGARSVELTSNAYQFNYDNLNQASPASFILTATARGTSSANIKYKFYKNGTLISSPSQPQTSNTLGPISDLPSANSLTGYSVELLEDDVVKATDSISVYGTKDGSDGITLIVPNDNHTVTTDSAGSPATLAGSGTIIKLLIGSQPLAATSSTTLSAGQFRASIAATGIQFPNPAITVFDSNTLVLGEAIDFSADSGTGILTVSFIRPGSSATEVITRNLSYSKSKQGQQGLAGSNGTGARSVELVSNYYQFNYNSNDEVFPTEFLLTATPRGTTSSDIKYKFYKDGVLITSPSQPQTSNTLGPITDVPSANSGTGYFVEMLEDGVVKATDSISIYGTKDGSDGVTLVVPNDNHTVTSDSDGVPSTLASSGSSIRLLVGSLALTATTALEPQVGQFRASIVPTGISFPSPAITIADSTTLRLEDATAFSLDSASAILTVEFVRPGKTVKETITRNLSYSKSKRGIQGLTGSTGTGARSVELISNSYQFNYNAANQASPTSFSLSATARGTTSSNIKYKFYKDGVVVSGPGIAAQPQTSNTLGPISSLPSANATIGYSVELLEDDVVKATDSISIYGTKDGSDGITLVVPNDSHTVTTDSSGTPLTLAGSGSIIKVLIGSQELNATTNSSLVAGQFRAASLVATGITFPTTITTVESTKVLKLADAIAFGADSATAVLTVEFIRPGGSATETIIRNLSYSKSKQGTEGEAAIIVEVPNTNHTFPADSNGNVSASSPDNYVGSGTTIAVSLGSTPLTYVSGSTPGEGQFTVTTSVSPSGAITVPTPSGSGTTTATVGKLSSFLNSVDVATVTYTITVRRPGYSAAETETFTRIGTYSKSKGGSSGIGARSVKLTANAYQFNYNSAGQVSPSSLTLTATSSGTTGTDIKYRFYKDGVVVSGAGIATQPQSSGTLGPLSTLPAANSSVSYSVELLEDGVVKANDSTSVNGTKDGSDGVTLSVPNDNHTVTAYSSGAPITLSGSGTDIRISVGSQPLTATTSASITAGQFRVSSFTPSGITFSGSPFTATGPNTLTLADATDFPAANKSASAALIVSFIRPNSTAVETIARTLSYSKSIEGEDAVTIEIPKLNHTFTSDSSGNISTSSPNNYTGSGTTVRALVGGTALTYTSGTPAEGQFAVSTSVSPTNAITVPAPTGTGTTATIGDLSSFSNSVDVATVTYTITLRRAGSTSTETFTQKGTYSKSKSGSNGIGARSVELTSSAYQINYNSSNQASPANFTLTATARGTDAGSVLQYRFSKNGTVLTSPAQPQDSNILGPISDLPAANALVGYSVELLEGPTTANLTARATDSVSIYGTKDGSDGVTLIVPNDNHTVTTDSNGVPLSLAGSGSSIQLIVGSQLLNATTGTLSAGQFRASISSTGITFPATPITVSGTDPKALVLGDATAFSSDAGSATLTVQFIRTGGSATESIVRNLSYAKSKQGENAVTINFSKPSHAFTAALDGTVSDFANSGATISVSVGSSALNYVSTLSGTTGQFTISSSVSPANSITVPAATGTGTPTATIGNVSAGTAFASSDAITVTYTITVRRPGTSGSEVFTRTTSYSKSRQGAVGADGVDTGLIFDFSQFLTIGGTDFPYGWNDTAASSTANSAVPTTIAFSSKVPSFTTSAISTSSIHGGRVARMNISDTTVNNERIIYLAEPVSVGQGNTYELSYRLTLFDQSSEATVGLYFYDANGNIITTTSASTAQTEYPYRFARHINNSSTADKVYPEVPTVGYFSFESGGSLKTFPSGTRYVRPYVKLISTANTALITTKDLDIDKLYFGIKTTPNNRTSIFIDNITGRVVIGESNADVTGGSGSLTNSKYDATANLEIVGTAGAGQIADIKITQGHVTFDPNNTSRGNDFAALRFAGWAGTYTGTSSAPGNMVLDERAEIRATYCSSGTESTASGSKGGAAIDFYTAQARTSVGYSSATPTAPSLRARITDLGQLLVGFSDSQTEINPNITVFTSPFPSTSSYTFNATNSNPKLAVNGNVYLKGSLIVETAGNNLLQGTTYVGDLEPISEFPEINLGERIPFKSVSTQILKLSTGRTGSTTPFATISTDSFDFKGSGSAGMKYYSSTGFLELFSGFLIVNQQALSPSADNGNASMNGGILLKNNSEADWWRTFVNNNGALCFNYNANGGTVALKAYISEGTAVGQLTFTGQHRNKTVDDLANYQDKIGMIVVSTGAYNSFAGHNSITINEALPYVELSSVRNQKSAFGVISESEDTGDQNRKFALGSFVTVVPKESDGNRLIINSLGEGAIWVTNINGNLENGDYITTCEIPGYGMRQDDDLLHNYTVAKITCDCTFDLNSHIYICEEFEFNGQTYRRAFVGCTYHCG